MTTHSIASPDPTPSPVDTPFDELGLVGYLTEALATAPRTPLYEHLIAAIEGAIRTGRLPPGAVLPREPDLASQLGLSRALDKVLDRSSRGEHP